MIFKLISLVIYENKYLDIFSSYLTKSTYTIWTKATVKYRS